MDWPMVVTRFYELLQAEFSTRVSLAVLWKYIGDEILFYKKLLKKDELAHCLECAHAAMLATIEALHKHHAITRELLSVKGAVWIANAEQIQPGPAELIKSNSRNIIFPSGEIPILKNLTFSARY
jgi:hypothetical protein